MKVLLDTNVLLDLLLDREPWATPAAEILAKYERFYACPYSSVRS